MFIAVRTIKEIYLSDFTLKSLFYERKKKKIQ